jgi:microcystin-dependent protein
MPTTNRGYATPATGSEVNTWGVVLNSNAALVDLNLGGVTSVSLSNANVTLNSTQASNGTIRFTGTLSANVVVTFPATQAWWTVENLCTVGNFYVAIIPAGGTQRIGCPPGEAVDVFSDGSAMKYRSLGIPIGGYWDYAGNAVPAWVDACTIPPFLLCGGQTFSAATYPVLAAIMQTTTLPDTYGRARFTLSYATNRITYAGSGIDGSTRFSSGGLQNHTNTINEMVQHNHGGVVNGGSPITFTMQINGEQATVDRTNFFPAQGPGPSTAQGAAFDSQTPSVTIPGGAITIPNQGSGTPYGIMPPAYIGGITMIRAA